MNRAAKAALAPRVAARLWSAAGAAGIAFLAVALLNVASGAPGWHLVVLGVLTGTAGLPHLADSEWQHRVLAAVAAVIVPAQLALHGVEELWHHRAGLVLETSPGLAGHTALILLHVVLACVAVVGLWSLRLLAVAIAAAMLHVAAAASLVLRRPTPVPALTLPWPATARVVVERLPWIAYAVRRGPPGLLASI